MGKVLYQCLLCEYKLKLELGKENYEEVKVCPKCNGALVDRYKLNKYNRHDELETSEEEIYINSMESWIKEQESRREQIVSTIKTSTEIVEQNKIQLHWLDKALEVAQFEFEEWKKNNNIAMPNG
ncbi:hypothetical protein Q1J45_25940 [Pseudomonas rhodesiae]